MIKPDIPLLLTKNPNIKDIANTNRNTAKEGNDMYSPLAVMKGAGDQRKYFQQFYVN